MMPRGPFRLPAPAARALAIAIAATIAALACLGLTLASGATAVEPDVNIQELRSRKLQLPVSTITAAQLVNTFDQSRAAGRVHEALDIMAPRGTPVLAVEDGRVARLFPSKPGGTTLYQFDNNAMYTYYYAHLDRYADGIAEGALLSKGQIIGYVGSTGNASPDAPHLHFAIFRLGPERQWWRGTAVNPFLVWRDAENTKGTPGR